MSSLLVFSQVRPLLSNMAAFGPRKLLALKGLLSTQA